MDFFCPEQLLAKYQTQIAVVGATRQYRYIDLAKRVHEILRTANLVKPYIVVVGEQSIDFICRFLAIHVAKKIPIVVNRHDLVQIEQLLEKIAGYWQFMDDLNAAAITREIPKGKRAANLLFLGMTSGTTGNSKVYQRDWASWCHGFTACREVFALDQYTCLATPSPLTTSLGMHTLILSLYLGKQFYLDTTVNRSKEDGNLILFTVPTMLSQQLASSLQVTTKHFFDIAAGIVTCGGELTQTLVTQWRAEHPTQNFYELYGSSETSLVAWQKIVFQKQPGCVGQLFAGVQLAFKETCVQVKSPYVFQGYLGETRQRTDFVQTDDVGRFKNERLFIWARKSEVINHGGNRLYPREIENLIAELVEEVVVFGVPDAVYGEKVVAIVRGQNSRKKLQARLARSLPSYKLPQEYLFVKHIPRSLNQKISRTKLVNLYQQGEWS
ncbi:AMP-binding protein [Liquorilactobacillus satsumensis]|uniref:AMP-binding protein n=1 Tax=Liquorilactobacillus satsumensis TaxID=259059 RepID=UPI001E5E7C69|nr:AMP-binding protein [Liquorilactobacillus satsumensis]MCC7667150.1 acyl-CoA synthetase [Liquorilactobacillus satsumensis]